MASYLNLSTSDEVIEFNNLLCYYTDINSLRKATDNEVSECMSILNNTYNLKWNKESKELIEYE
jgi:hypothetical protein